MNNQEMGFPTMRKYSHMKLAVLVVLMAAVSATAAQAGAITYKLFLTMDGSFNGVDLTDATFAETVVADTTDVFSIGPRFENTSNDVTFTLKDTSANLNLSGSLSGPGLFNNVLLNPSLGGEIFFDQSYPGGNAGEAILDSDFGGYDLTTALPLTFGIPQIIGGSFFTPGGDQLTFTNATAASFEAVTGVPEPASWALTVAGFGGLGAAMRSRRRTSAQSA